MQGSMKNVLSIESPFHKGEFLTEIDMDEIKSVFPEKHEFHKRHVSKTISPFVYQVSDARSRIKSFLTEKLGTSWKLFIENMVERIEQVFK